MGRRAVALPSGMRGMMEDECEGQSAMCEMCHLFLYWDCETASFTVVRCCAKLQRSYSYLWLSLGNISLGLREDEKQQDLR